MLKLEKAAKTRELNVILRDKPALMSRTFLVALSYALFCHLGAVLLFQVSPFKISYEASVISPVMVASDFFSDHQQVTVHYDEHGQVPDYLLAPRAKPSQLPAFDQKTDPIAMDIVKPLSLSKSEFRTLEDRIEVQPMINIFPAATKKSPFAVHASGVIADKEIVINNQLSLEKIEKFAAMNPSMKLNSPYYLSFSVMVEQNKGEIIWWEAHNENIDPKVYWLMISLLEDLRFEKDSQKIIENGTIELTINYQP
jgi:hypothetical protein